MKTTRKLLALVVAMVMIMAMASTAMAASITINDQTVSGTSPDGTVSTTYTYYRLLRASINGDAVSYYLKNTTDDELRALLDAVTVDGIDLFNFTLSANEERWIASINNKADNTSFTDADAKNIANALATDDIKNAALDNGTFTSSNGSAKAEGLNAGYYLITSNLGSNLVVRTLGEETINTKNEYITTGKTADKANMAVGDKVIYTITVSIPETAIVGDPVTVHDTLDSHLAILKADGLSIAEVADDYGITAKIDGTGDSVDLTVATAKAGETFARSFTVTNAMLGHSVVLKYTAELMSTAADGTATAADTEYGNKAYTNTPAYETTTSIVNVKTFGFTLHKEFQDAAPNNNNKATFELTDASKNLIKFKKDGSTYTKHDSNESAPSSTLTVNSADDIKIVGLAAGTYTLTEKTTITGYNLLEDPIIVTISDAGELTYKIGTGGTPTPSTEKTVNVVNNHGSLLPSTGGIGTTIFYVLGGILVVGAVVLLVTKRRMNANA